MQRHTKYMLCGSFDKLLFAQGKLRLLLASPLLMFFPLSFSAFMNNHKAAGRSNVETRTFSSPMHNTDTYSTLKSGEGRTSRVITTSISVSEEALGTTASYTERTRSGVLAQESFSLTETKTVDSSQRTVDISYSEAMSLKVPFPKTAISSLPEDNVAGEFTISG